MSDQTELAWRFAEKGTHGPIAMPAAYYASEALERALVEALAGDDEGRAKRVAQVLYDFKTGYSPPGPVVYAGPRIMVAEEFGNAPWTQDRTIQRYSPWVLVNPITLGETRDFQGNILAPKISLTNRDLSTTPLDEAQDWLLRGNISWEGPVPVTGAIAIKGGRNVRIIGVDTGDVKFSAIGQTGSLYMEGLRFDGRLGDEFDAFYVGGMPEGSGDYPGLCIQNCIAIGGHGTNRDHNMVPGTLGSGQNSVRMTSLKQTAPRIFTAVLEKAFPGATQPFASFTGSVDGASKTLNVTAVTAGHKLGAGMLVQFAGKQLNQSIDSQVSGTPGGVGVYLLKYTQPNAISSRAMSANAWEFCIGGAQINGVTSTNITGFNQNCDFVSYDPATLTLVLRISVSGGPDADDVSGVANTVATAAGGIVTGATVWCMNATPGEHADGIQCDGGRQYAVMEIHNFTANTNYCGIIITGAGIIYVSNFNYRINLANSPMDNATEFMRLGFQGQAPGLDPKQLYNCWAEVRPTNSLANMAPSLVDGAVMLPGRPVEAISFNRPEFTGGIERGIPPGGDFAHYDQLGFNYAYDPTKYSGYFVPIAANLTGIFASSLPSIPEGLAGGTNICLMDVSHTLGRHSAIIDLTVVGGNVSASHFAFHGRWLVAGRTQFDYETTPKVNGVPTAVVTIRATIRGTSEHIEQSFAFIITDAQAASGLTVTSAFAAQGAAVNAQPSQVQVYPNPLDTTPYHLDIGTASSDRFLVVFAAMWNQFSAARVLNETQSIKPTGQTAVTLVKRTAKQSKVANANNWAEMAMYVGNVPVGTTADITVGATGSPTAGGVSIRQVRGISSPVPYSTDTGEGTAIGATASLIVDAPPNGVVILGGLYTPTANTQKWHSGARFVNGPTVATFFIRARVTVGTSGPLIWERSTDNLTWTAITSDYDALVENTGGGSTVISAASFGPAT